MLECISKGYQLLCNGHINEYSKLVKRRMLDEIADSSWGDMFLSPDLTAYIKAKGMLDERELY